MARLLGLYFFAMFAVACASKTPSPAEPPRDVASKPLFIEKNAATVKSTKSLSTGRIAKTCSYMAREEDTDFALRVGSDDAGITGLFYVRRDLLPLKDGLEPVWLRASRKPRASSPKSAATSRS